MRSYWFIFQKIIPSVYPLVLGLPSGIPARARQMHFYFVQPDSLLHSSALEVEAVPSLQIFGIKRAAFLGGEIEALCFGAGQPGELEVFGLIADPLTQHE